MVVWVPGALAMTDPQESCEAYKKGKQSARCPTEGPKAVLPKEEQHRRKHYKVIHCFLPFGVVIALGSCLLRGFLPLLYSASSVASSSLMSPLRGLVVTLQVIRYLPEF